MGACHERFVVRGQRRKAFIQSGCAVLQFAGAFAQLRGPCRQGGCAVVQVGKAGVQFGELFGEILCHSCSLRQGLAGCHCGEQCFYLVKRGVRISFSVFPAKARDESVEDRLDGRGGDAGHHPVQAGVIGVEIRAEGCGKIQLPVHAGNRPAEQDLPSHLRDHGGIVQAQRRDAFFRKGKGAQHQGRGIALGPAGHGEPGFAGHLRQLFGGDLLAVQGDRDDRENGRRLVPGAVIGDIFAAGLPGEGVAVLGEGHPAVDGLDLRQQRFIGNLVFPVRVFQADLIGDGDGFAVSARNDIDLLMLDGLRRNCGAAGGHGKCRGEGGDFSDFHLHNRSFLSGMFSYSLTCQPSSCRRWCARSAHPAEAARRAAETGRLQR